KAVFCSALGLPKLAIGGRITGWVTPIGKKIILICPSHREGSHLRRPAQGCRREHTLTMSKILRILGEPDKTALQTEHVIFQTAAIKRAAMAQHLATERSPLLKQDVIATALATDGN